MAQLLTSDPLADVSEYEKLGDDFIAHYGTKGMKWGVWNAETAARYAGRSVKGMRKKMSSFVDMQKKKAVKKKNDWAQELQEARQAKAEQSAVRKELGMTRQQYDSLRKTTLKSHDPSVVAKGMHTLTDAELKAKIDRLKQEEIISTMATSKETRLANQRQARSNALKANPLVNLGLNLADAKARQVLGLKGEKDKNKGNDNDGGGKQNDDNVKTDNSEGKKHNEASGIDNSWKINDSGMKKKASGIDNSWKINDSGMKKIRDVAAKVSTKSTPVNNHYENVGRKLLTDGSVRAQVISVETIDDGK